jgi:hypothetical protein
MTVRAGGEVDLRYGDKVYLTPRSRPPAPFRRAGAADRMKRLDGKSALITGAARGIGRAFAEAYAAKARASPSPTSTSTARATARREIGEAAIAVEMDVTRQESIDAAVAETVAAFGQIDILINNAAVFTAAPIVEITREDYQRTSSTSTSRARCSPCRPSRGT